MLRGDADIAVALRQGPTVDDRPRDCSSVRSASDATHATCLIGASLDELAPGAHVATGSVRRRAQLMRVRPDLQFDELRGNIHTRLGKVPARWSDRHGGGCTRDTRTDGQDRGVPPAELFVPSPGQGCVAIECRTGDDEMRSMLHAVDHAPSRRAVEVERAFLAELGSGCSLPVGAHVVDRKAHGISGCRRRLPSPHRSDRATRSVTTLRWFARGARPVDARQDAMKPLAGRTVVITRSADQAAAMSELVASFEAQRRWSSR